MPIEVLNIESLIPLELVYALDERAVKVVLADIMAAARDFWITQAGRTFHTTKQTYIQGIQEVEWLGEDTARISLVGVLPNILEQGMGQRDLHDTLLGPNVPVAPLGQPGKHPRKEGGYYRAVPFRHRTPGQGAHGTPMGMAHEKMLGSEWARELGKDVYKAAQNLEASVTDPYTKQTKWGGRLDTRQLANKKGSVYVPKLKESHAVDPYQGMVRMEKTYEGATQSSYATFRTISVDGEGKGVGSADWVRPATTGKFLAHQVAEHVATRLAPQAFEAYVRGLR
jgi:hypothetical protein